MKKILLVGINEKIHTTRKIIEELKIRKIPFDFIKWRSLVFYDGHIKSNNKNIAIKNYQKAFFDIPCLDVKIKESSSTKILDFRLFEEFQILISKLKKYKIPLLNKNFFSKYQRYDKFLQSQLFSEYEIPSIPTLHLSDNDFVKVTQTIKKTKLGFPIVAKESSGGMGEKVWKIKNNSELQFFLQDKRNRNIVFQPFIKNDGDFRVLVVGGRSLGIMKRKSAAGEWKNNFALGGTIERYNDKKMESFAEKICEKLGLDYAGIDIFKIKNKYMVIEINIFACFEGFEKTYPELNIPKKIIDNLIKKLT